MPTTNTGPRLAPLPMQVRPVLGEGIASYIQRLAQANHLSPDELTAVLCPRGRHRPPELHLLAQLTNSTVDGLRRALPDAPGRVNTDANREGPFPQRVDDALPDLFDRVDLLMALGEAPPPGSGSPAGRAFLWSARLLRLLVALAEGNVDAGGGSGSAPQMGHLAVEEHVRVQYFHDCSLLYSAEEEGVVDGHPSFFEARHGAFVRRRVASPASLYPSDGATRLRRQSRALAERVGAGWSAVSEGAVGQNGDNRGGVQLSRDLYVVGESVQGEFQA